MEEKKRKTFRRRETIVSPEGYGYKAEWPTSLQVYPSWIRIVQERPRIQRDPLEDIIILDPAAMEYLIQLWQEVKGG